MVEICQIILLSWTKSTCIRNHNAVFHRTEYSYSKGKIVGICKCEPKALWKTLCFIPTYDRPNKYPLNGFCFLFGIRVLFAWLLGFFIFIEFNPCLCLLQKLFYKSTTCVFEKMKIHSEASANQMLLQYLSLKEDTKVSPFIDLSYGECPDHKALYMYVQLRVHVLSWKHSCSSPSWVCSIP